MLVWPYGRIHRMNTYEQIQDIQQSLYRLRVAQGQYLRDVPYDDLCRECHAELWGDAIHLHSLPDLELRLVKRGHKMVWRFMNKNGL